MSQTNFFMLPEDERAFFAALRERGDTQFVRGVFHRTKRPPLVDRLKDAGPEVVLVNTAFGVPPVLTERGAGEFAGMYGFDSLRDPHIRWSRCRRDRGALLAGRIFAKIGWATAYDQTVYRRWYSSISRLINQNSEPAPTSAGRWRIAPAAARWWREGHLFCFGDELALRAGPDLKHVAR